MQKEQPAPGTPSETPRTDAECFDFQKTIHGDTIKVARGPYVYADFARTLERELAAKEVEVQAQRDKTIEACLHYMEGMKMLSKDLAAEREKLRVAREALATLTDHVGKLPWGTGGAEMDAVWKRSKEALAKIGGES